MSTISPRIDMAKVAKAVAQLAQPATDRIRRPNPYHDLPPVDLTRRRRVKNIHADHCCGFEDPNFLH
jgi:hypothetical protein